MTQIWWRVALDGEVWTQRGWRVAWPQGSDHEEPQRDTVQNSQGWLWARGTEPRWRTTGLIQGATWAQARLEAGQERKFESEGLPGEPKVQRGLEEGERARGEVSWGKWCRMVQSLIWGWQQPPGAHVTLTYPPSQKYVFVELYREKEHKDTYANSIRLIQLWPRRQYMFGILPNWLILFKYLLTKTAHIYCRKFEMCRKKSRKKIKVSNNLPSQKCLHVFYSFNKGLV